MGGSTVLVYIREEPRPTLSFYAGEPKEAYARPIKITPRIPVQTGIFSASRQHKTSDIIKKRTSINCGKSNHRRA